MQALEPIRPAALRLPRLRLVLPRLTVDIVLVVALFALYLTAGVVLALINHSLVGDAWSRVGNAYYVLYSRDPHLAAMGFVWNPLPSLLTLPFLPLMAAWPPLVREGFINNIYSAIFMAFAAQQILGTMRDMRVATPIALAVTLLFALHPIIVQYGANGMTEALFILLLVVLIRNLTRWSRTNGTAPLVGAGIALGLAYLVRYEAAPVGAAAGLYVAGWTFMRLPGPRRDRLIGAIADGLVFGAPLAASFVLWALASWLMVGEPFEQFSSAYGTTSQLAADLENIYFGTGQGTPDAIVYSARQIFGLTPLLLPILAIGFVTALVRRDATILAMVAVFGSIIVFALWAWLTGKTGGWLRYYITVIPFTALAAGWAIGHVWSWWDMPGRAGWIGRAFVGGRRSLAIGVTGAVLAMLAVSLPSGAGVLFDRTLGRPEGTINDIRRWESGRDVAAYIDGMGLDEGSVLLDVFLGFPIVLHTEDPRQFVITPDRDFPAVLQDPDTFGVEYLLVPPPDVELGELDAVNRAFPGVYEDGGGIAELVTEFDSPVENFHWRLYRLAEAGVSSP